MIEPDHVTGQQEIEELPPPVEQDTHARRPSRQDQMRAGDIAPLDHQVASGPELLGPGNRLAKRLHRRLVQGARRDKR